MKGLHKYILISIIEHATPDDFGQFLLMVRHVEKDFKWVVNQMKRDFEIHTFLNFVKYQTHKICLLAVKKIPENIVYVKNKTREIKLEAVKQNGSLLFNIEEQTEEICIEAVKIHGFALEFVENQTPEICREAIKNNPMAIGYVRIKYEGSP